MLKFEKGVNRYYITLYGLIGLSIFLDQLEDFLKAVDFNMETYSYVKYAIIIKNYFY